MSRRRTYALLVASVGMVTALLPGPGLAAESADADLALIDGVVWTGTGTTAAAVSVRGDRILAVGSTDAVLATAGPDTRIVDLGGAWVGPGFRDNHVHVLDTGIPGLGSGAAPPSWDGYDPVTAEALRGAILAYHTSIFAQGSTPEDGCSRSEVTEEMKSTILAAQDEIARQGLVATVEAGLSDLGLFDTLLQLSSEDQLKVRWLVRFGAGCMEQAAQEGWISGWGDDWVRVAGIKLYADGWLGPRSAALREPYEDRPAFEGYLFLDEEAATAEVQRAHELGFNITTHAIGDEGIATVLAAYENAGATPDRRWQIEHAQVTDLGLIDRMAASGVVGSIQLSFATTDMRFAEQALGTQRAATAYAWRTMDERGVPLAGGSDYPVEVLAPLWGLQRVITRTEFDGVPEGGWHPEERLEHERALRLITADVARATFEEDQRGVLTAGRVADLVVIREDLGALPEDCLAAATVLMTVVNGRIAFEGEQAYPPGDATCPSGAAPASTPVLRDVQPPANADTGDDPVDGLPATGGGLVLVGWGAAALGMLAKRRSVSR